MISKKGEKNNNTKNIRTMLIIEFLISKMENKTYVAICLTIELFFNDQFKRKGKKMYQHVDQ